MTRILIKNGIIVPMDGRQRSIEGKALLIEDDRIAAIDDGGTLAAAHDVDEVIDASCKAILPGFINNHAHLGPSGLFRGIAEDLEVAQYIGFAVPVLDRLTEDDVLSGRSFDDPLVQTGPGVREPQNRRAVIDLN